mgnify:CR=1 FL=1
MQTDCLRGDKICIFPKYRNLRAFVANRCLKFFSRSAHTIFTYIVNNRPFKVRFTVHLPLIYSVLYFFTDICFTFDEKHVEIL